MERQGVVEARVDAALLEGRPHSVAPGRPGSPLDAHGEEVVDMAELVLRREVKRVPLMGGRISIEAIREGLARVLGGGPSEPPVPAPSTERRAPSPLGIG